VDAVIASTSLHHVADPAEVIERMAGSLAPGGRVVVVEWAWEAFDEPTAHWCFQRLAQEGEQGWLHRRRDEWIASRRAWGTYLRGWAQMEQLHRAEMLLRLLDVHFDREHLAHGAYFFPDLAETREEDERAAIGAGQIRATRVDYVGRVPAPMG
jgi:SAM-dependent methyltransferase